MRRPSWRIHPQAFLDNGVQVRAIRQSFAVNGLDAQKSGAHLALQFLERLAVVAEVVENAGQEGGGGDGPGHHDDVEVGCDFFGSCRGALSVEDVVHEVSTFALEPKAATQTIG